jgi:hypothetical protein
VGCSEGRAVGGLHILTNASGDDLSVIIAPGCSDDMRDITAVHARAAGGYNTTVIASLSTAPSLADDATYPHLARMSTSLTRS